MKIQQLEDKGLAHFSYAVLSDDISGIVVIDPARNVAPYLNYALQQNVSIVAIIETHLHADFVSGHLELHRETKAPVYCSALQKASYPHIPFDEGSVIELGEIRLSAQYTRPLAGQYLCSDGTLRRE